MKVCGNYDQEFMQLIDGINSSETGSKLLALSGIGEEDLDFLDFTNKFLKTSHSVSDLSIDPNANVSQRNTISYIMEAPKSMFRFNNYFQLWRDGKDLFNKDRADEMVEADILGDIYIADFHLWNIPYCYAFSAMDILERGLPFIDRPKSKPASHLDSFVQHVIQSIIYFTNSIAGAVALPDLFVAFSFLVQRDRKVGYPTKNPDEFNKYVLQQFQILTFAMNQPFRSGFQSPFVNFSAMDEYFLESMFSNAVFKDPKTGDISQVDLEEVDKLQKMYVEWFVEENKTQIFTFPVLTACLSTEVDKETGVRKARDYDFKYWVAKVNTERALLNIYSGDSATLSSCCRLRNNTNYEYFNSFGSGGVKIGSHRVCTVNLPRLAQNSDNFDDFVNKVLYNVRLSQDVLTVHRNLLQREIDLGVLPLYDHHLIDLRTQYSTVGVIGFFEAFKILGFDISRDGHLDKAELLLNRINNLNDERSLKDGHPYNLEQIPGESAAVKLAKKDNILYGMSGDIYSNQFIPLNYPVSMAQRFKVQGLLDNKMSGGSILHINIAEKIPSVEILMTLMDYAISQGIVYFAFNYNICKCDNGHITVGVKDYCSMCGEKIIEKYTRVVGYYVNVSSWNEVRRGKADYASRRWA